MRIQVLTLRYSAAHGGFDDGQLEEYVRTHRVLSVSEHFFCVDKVPHLACVVRWQEEPDAGSGALPQRASGEVEPPTARAKARKTRPDPAADLDERQRALFEDLRAWRRERARREGLPAYHVLTDRQLAVLVRSFPGDLEALAGVEGVGQGKAKLFGEELLARMGGIDRQRAAAAQSGDGA